MTKQKSITPNRFITICIVAFVIAGMTYILLHPSTQTQSSAVNTTTTIYQRPFTYQVNIDVYGNDYYLQNLTEIRSVTVSGFVLGANLSNYQVFMVVVDRNDTPSLSRLSNISYDPKQNISNFILSFPYKKNITFDIQQIALVNKSQNGKSFYGSLLNCAPIQNFPSYYTNLCRQEP